MNDKNFIQQLLIAYKAIGELESILDNLHILAEDDNYTESKEQELIVILVDKARASLPVFEKSISNFMELGYKNDDDKSESSEAISNSMSALSILRSIFNVENVHAALTDGVSWSRYGKYEEDSSYAFSSIKELSISNLIILSKYVNKIYEQIIKTSPTLAALKIIDLESEIESSVDVEDITSLCNTLSDKKSFISDPANINSSIRTMLGLVDGNLAINRKLNISEIEVLKTQASGNFRIAARLKYMLDFTEDLVRLDNTLVSALVKTLELESANVGLAVDTEFNSIYPVLDQSVIPLFNFGSYLTIRLGTETVSEEMANGPIVKEGRLKSISDIHVIDPIYFNILLGSNESDNNMDVNKLIAEADLASAYTLLIISSMALTLVMGRYVSCQESSASIDKRIPAYETTRKTNSLSELIYKRIFEINPDTKEFIVSEKEILSDSLNNFIERRQLISETGKKLAESFVDILDTKSEHYQSSKNCLTIAYRISSLLY